MVNELLHLCISLFKEILLNVFIFDLTVEEKHEDVFQRTCVIMTCDQHLSTFHLCKFVEIWILEENVDACSIHELLLHSSVERFNILYANQVIVGEFEEFPTKPKKVLEETWVRDQFMNRIQILENLRSSRVILLEFLQLIREGSFTWNFDDLISGVNDKIVTPPEPDRKSTCEVVFETFQHLIHRTHTATTL